MPSAPRRWCDSGKPGQGGAGATTRCRHDPPPPPSPPPGAGYKVVGRDPISPSGGLVWAARCARNKDALCTLTPAKDPHLRPLRPLHLDLHGGKPWPPRPKARLPSPGGPLPVVPRYGRPCLKGWAGGPSRRLCASFMPSGFPGAGRGGRGGRGTPLTAAGGAGRDPRREGRGGGQNV